MPSIDDSNSTTTRLLTLLNVSATKAGKRQWNYAEDSAPAEKLNKRKSARFSGPMDVSEAEVVPTEPEDETVETNDMDDTTEQTDGMRLITESQWQLTEAAPGTSDAYEVHFGPQSAVLSDTSRAAVEQRAWKTERSKHRKMGATVELIPEGAASNNTRNGIDVSNYCICYPVLTVCQIVDKFKTSFRSRQTRQTRGMTHVPLH